MKKEDLTKAYDKLEISQMQKNKIFNSIMKKKKKKKYIWFSVINFSTLAVASVIIFFLVGNSSDGTVLKEKTKEYLSLESRYSKEILVNATTYLSQNEIDLTTINVGEEKNIDSKKIINNEEYNSCNGSLTIRKIDNNNYEYSTNVNCNETNDGTEVEFIIYDGDITEIFDVTDGIMIVTSESINNYDMKVYMTLYDYDGKRIWTKEYKPDNISNNLTYAPFIYDIVKVQDKYLVNGVFGFYQNGEYMDSEQELRIYSLDGQFEREIDYQVSAYEIINVHYQKTVGEYVYYSNSFSSENGLIDTQGKLEININNLDDIKVFALPNGVGNELDVIDDKLYYSKVNSEIRGEDRRVVVTSLELRALSWDGTIENEYTIEFNEGADCLPKSLIYNDDYIFLELTGSIDYENYTSTIYKFTKELELVDKINYRSLVNNETVYVHDMKYLNDKINLNLYNYNLNKQYILELDENGKLISKKEINSDLIINTFDEFFLINSYYNDNGLVQIYSTSQDETKNVLFAFYKTEE